MSKNIVYSNTVTKKHQTQSQESLQCNFYLKYANVSIIKHSEAALVLRALYVLNDTNFWVGDISDVDLTHRNPSS